MAIIGILLFGIALIAGPIFAGAFGVELNALVTSIMMVSGLLISLFAGILLIVTKLYVKTKASEAFVRTGGRGLLVVKDGGALVIPIIHRMIPVSLRTFKLEVKREDEGALITADKLRCDIKAEFYVKVAADEKSIQNAARSFGEKMSEEFVKQLVEEKLVDALRTVAAKRTLEQLNSERSEFITEVTNMVTNDLSHNGLALETATISALDQTNAASLKDDNIFDAVGKRTIAEITQRNLTERNRLEREGEQARKEQDVQTRKRVLAFEQDEELAAAEQAANVKKAQAEQNAEAEERRIQTEKSVELENVSRAREVALAQKQQEEAVQVAERKKQQSIEVAERAKQQAVAAAEEQTARAETEKANTERARQEAQEQIKTVQVVEEAERKKREAVLFAEAKAEQEYVAQKKKADAEAYSIEKKAEARQKSAEADAEATRKKALADKDAKLAEAEGVRAVEMIPVDVKAKDVEAEKARVEDVTIPEMRARQEFGKSDIEFRLGLEKIKVDGQVEIERARASMEIGKKFDVKAFATLEQVDGVIGNLVRGHRFGEFANGVGDSLEGGTLESALAALRQLGQAWEQGKAVVFNTGEKPNTDAPAAPGGQRTLMPDKADSNGQKPPRPVPRRTRGKEDETAR